MINKQALTLSQRNCTWAYTVNHEIFFLQKAKKRLAWHVVSALTVFTVTKAFYSYWRYLKDRCKC